MKSYTLGVGMLLNLNDSPTKAELRAIHLIKAVSDENVRLARTRVYYPIRINKCVDLNYYGLVQF